MQAVRHVGLETCLEGREKMPVAVALEELPPDIILVPDVSLYLN